MSKVMVYLMYKLNKCQKIIQKYQLFSLREQKEVTCLSQMDVFTSNETFCMHSLGHAVFLLYPVF